MQVWLLSSVLGLYHLGPVALSGEGPMAALECGFFCTSGAKDSRGPRRQGRSGIGAAATRLGRIRASGDGRDKPPTSRGSHLPEEMGVGLAHGDHLRAPL